MAELRKRGLITAVVCSDPFMRLGQAQAKTFGVPDLPLLRIPHPLGGISVEQVEGRADAALASLVTLIKEHQR
jgi:hypothetical protein